MANYTASWKSYALSLIAGILYVVAFSPFNFWPAVFISLSIIFKVWLDCRTLRAAFLNGLFFGLGLFGFGVSWIYISLNTFGNMAPVLAAVAVLLFVTVLALYPALVGLIQQLIKNDSISIQLLTVIVPLMVISEWVREWLFTGLPWLAAGYSQIDTVLSEVAPIGGVYSVSLVICLICAAVLLIFHRKIINSLVICLALVVFYSFTLNLQWTKSIDKSLKVKLVQANISISNKWDYTKSLQIVETYLDLSKKGAISDLVIWPEAAVPMLMSEIPKAFWQQLRENSSEHFMFGVIENNAKSNKIYNTVATTSQELELYRKSHLVPFGEYLPFQKLISGLLRYLNIPMSNLSPYEADQAPLTIKGIKLGISICYEDAFTNVIGRSMPESNVLVNLSEDAWFGNSLAPHQRLQMARMRAKEYGRNMIRVSNSGLSSLINHNGKINDITPQFKPFVLDSTVIARTGVTPFALFGHKLVLAIVFFLLTLALVVNIMVKKIDDNKYN